MYEEDDKGRIESFKFNRNLTASVKRKLASNGYDFKNIIFNLYSVCFDQNSSV